MQLLVLRNSHWNFLCLRLCERASRRRGALPSLWVKPSGALRVKCRITNGGCRLTRALTRRAQVSFWRCLSQPQLLQYQQWPFVIPQESLRRVGGGAAKSPTVPRTSGLRVRSPCSRHCLSPRGPLRFLYGPEAGSITRRAGPFIRAGVTQGPNCCARAAVLESTIRRWCQRSRDAVPHTLPDPEFSVYHRRRCCVHYFEHATSYMAPLLSACDEIYSPGLRGLAAVTAPSNPCEFMTLGSRPPFFCLNKEMCRRIGQPA